MCDWDMFFRRVTAIRMPLGTGYLYAFDHGSSLISVTSTYVDSVSRIILSGTSVGKLAILIRLNPMPVNSNCTVDNSPLSCRNSSWPFVVWRIDCAC